MSTIAFHTLGCKVNQYDTEAMRELLLDHGWKEVPFSEPADVYLINTCTVTGTGDRKSLQLSRKIKREHPGSVLVLCGCLAQCRGNDLLTSAGADLVLGVQHRGKIVELLNQVISTREKCCMVKPFDSNTPFEPLSIRQVSGRTRAAVKIQEGCNNHCTYCIIPSVRGPIRSRSLESLRDETLKLRDVGFTEIVLTGIHLASYGKETKPSRYSLLDAISTVHDVDGIQRIRLGSLEPVVATEEFCRALKDLPKVCPQFHLALQSGSDTVLSRMKRRYNTFQYREAADRLRKIYPKSAMTTDILTGFPGETEQEFEETKSFIREMRYARIHVFPYSPRRNTPAAQMAGQLTDAEKEKRARELIALGNHVSHQYLETWLGEPSSVLIEEISRDIMSGYTPEYIRVQIPFKPGIQSGETVPVLLNGFTQGGMTAELLRTRT